MNDMKQAEFNINSVAVVKIAVLVSFVAMTFSALASSHGAHGLARDSVNREVVIEDPDQMPRLPVKPEPFVVYPPKAVRDSLESTDKIFYSVEQMPQFPGGEAALMKYLQENVKYPPKAAKDSIQGRVVVRFVVDSLGYVGDVKVLRSVSADLDAEAVRVVKTLPRFAPGRMFGKAVNVWYTLPVTFKLQDKLEPEKPKDVEVKAEFPGGEEALNQFLKDHIKYPPKAAKKRIQGRVEVAFWIDKSGKIHDVRVVDSVDKDLDREAVRVCKLLPDFIPATVNGELVEVLFKLPIRFKIPGLKTQYLKSVQIDSK